MPVIAAGSLRRKWETITPSIHSIKPARQPANQTARQAAERHVRETCKVKDGDEVALGKVIKVSELIEAAPPVRVYIIRNGKPVLESLTPDAVRRLSEESPDLEIIHVQDTVKVTADRMRNTIDLSRVHHNM